MRRCFIEPARRSVTHTTGEGNVGITQAIRKAKSLPTATNNEQEHQATMLIYTKKGVRFSEPSDLRATRPGPGTSSWPTPVKKGARGGKATRHRTVSKPGTTCL